MWNRPTYAIVRARRDSVVRTFSACGTSLASPQRRFSSWFEEQPGGGQRNVEDKAVAAFAVNADRLEKGKTIINKKAHGIPFHISDAEAVDNVCRHHGTAVEIHSVERFLMPFWLTETSAAGTFKADLLQHDRMNITQPHYFLWLEGPRYQFNYPFGEYMPMNQVSASYREPLEVVERCLTGTHVPSMLLSRFELLHEVEKMEHRPTVIPFTMSTITALSVIERRVNRRVVLDRIDRELRKFHGSFLKSNVNVTSLQMVASSIRPAFLPLFKLTVSTISHSTPVPAFICGATGKVVGPVLHVQRRKRLGLAVAAAVGTLLSLAPLVEPGVATAAALAVVASSGFVQQAVQRARFVREQAHQMAQLKSVGVLNLVADSAGYRWTPEEEEKEEYEYREELRRQARARDAFEQRVKEEAARDRARAHGTHFDPKSRRRTDLTDVDPRGYYELLGLKGKEFSATAKDITKAFREAVRIHHPDVHPEGEAENKKRHMQRIIEAYKILHNPKTKKSYDSGEMSGKSQETS
ncbi:DnaJ domain-containing protein / J35 / JDP35 [Leishmania donovani]|uniref:DnaJ domain family protein n=1 Tax=Leishmania donovani TaxID=5661 RepID=A0A504XYD0_LEIDO|nr:DnaJ domain family protein [Leishmania donovani]CAJ1987275.1 DnaJ domain-containing protein / J35 / JDP35 [Leishmania donovani]VDZ43164.1 DnaJ_domain_containing_protein_putative/Pfam:PF00226 [Leishmania donovani]